ncbi:cell division protein FtsZ [Mycoplasma sp. NEAQ87857]|uniref:cell division protein FtsZ n=1 Tax=Mycoplasma sp. NEAQ87857 TaxID=2683967 RepID=UPI001315B73E|nr:cell division protein FtsZ [Mycoplasma sp. NEAQ87857]QGZ97561.1 cell division protein FtsZ [Mycoplasma sp. NEAQ87857]
MSQLFDQKIENIEKENEEIIDKNTANITLKVIGVGGSGNNAVKTMLQERFTHVDFVVANTDAQALATVECGKKIKLGKETRGLGAGSNPEIGASAAKESTMELQEELAGADVVVIAAGFGGGTGTGAAPVVAEIAKSNGALTIAIITTPFEYEGPKRKKIANQGIEELKKHVDSYVILSNEKLADNYGDLPIADTFKLANISLKNIILAIHDILYRIGNINIDYADAKKILTDAGLTVVGIGQSTGKDRAIKAVDKAFEQNLYKYDIKTAKRILVNIQYDNKATLAEIKKAVNRVHEILAQNREEEDYECIIGQEAVETNNNSEIFKISIIAGGADINSTAEDYNNGEVSDLFIETDFISKEVVKNDNNTLSENVKQVLFDQQKTAEHIVSSLAEKNEQTNTVELNQTKTNTFNPTQTSTTVKKEETLVKTNEIQHQPIEQSMNDGVNTIEISSMFDIEEEPKNYNDIYDEKPEDDVDDNDRWAW